MSEQKKSAPTATAAQGASKNTLFENNTTTKQKKQANSDCEAELKEATRLLESLPAQEVSRLMHMLEARSYSDDTLARSVKTEMRRRRITQDSLAVKMNLSCGTISRKLNGKSVFTLDNLFCLSHVLDITPAEVYKMGCVPVAGQFERVGEHHA